MDNDDKYEGLGPNMAAEELALLLRIWEVFDTNLAPKRIYLFLYFTRLS
jgi:hypothetical protein